MKGKAEVAMTNIHTKERREPSRASGESTALPKH